MTGRLLASQRQHIVRTKRDTPISGAIPKILEFFGD